MSISASSALTSLSSSQSLSAPQKVKLHSDDSQQDNQKTNQALQATSNTVVAKAGINITA
jgi:hypothetical protein